LRPPVPRFVRWAVALAVIAALTLAVFQYWGTSQYGTAVAGSSQFAGQPAIGGPATEQNPGWMQTRWGPLSSADRDLLVMVRQAGLSGGSSGKRAEQQTSNQQVRSVARRIWVDYGDLDNQVRAVAGKLGVPLPDLPTAAQQGWLKDLSGRSGAEYDRMFAQGLRITDGEVLPTITAVRAGTRNELVRSFAANAAALVNRHMDVLERTGLVDYSKLSAPQPAAADVAAGGPAQRIDQVVNATPVPTAGAVTGIDANAMVAALVSIAALLIALGLLGSTSRRVRRAYVDPQHRGTPRGLSQQRPRQRRHAAHRW
jgi:predicted outer membrane protein